MKIEVLRSEFHELIDKIDDPEVLTQFYGAINQSLKAEGSIWRSLTKEQQAQVLEAYEDSEDDANLISLSDVKARYKNEL